MTLEKAQLAKEEIVIGAQDPAVRLTPVTTAPSRPDAEAPIRATVGMARLRVSSSVGPEFFEPLSDEECGSGRDPGTP